MIILAQLVCLVLIIYFGNEGDMDTATIFAIINTLLAFAYYI